MPLEAGTRLGPYEIIAPLGQGGMGEVYRARDTRLGRDVAVKVLPQHLSEQPEVRARFEREARAVSSLNHPNICTLHDVGREGDVDYLVLELVDGETLEQRLARGRVPTAEALRLGAQIADALDRAHRAGVIHRDLKPSNVMLTRSGAKLMDFGLARATDAGVANGSVSLTQSPTMARSLTAEGTLLGTFQYMAPEQLEGREADARSDIWALGCVLYELFSGKRAFEGRSQASLIAAILERDPPPVGEPPSGAPPPSVSASRPVPPQGIERLIRNCLAKDPEERIQTAHDVKLQLRGIAEGAGLELSGVAPGSSTLAAAGATAGALAEVRNKAKQATRLAWGVCALVAIVAAASVAWLWPQAHRPAAPALRFRLGAAPGLTDTAWPRVSPDGKALLLLVVDSTGAAEAAVRRLDQVDVHVIPGTQGLTRPYWSPDGKEVAFVANGKLQRVALDGGSPVVICDSPSGADLSWSPKGKILIDGQVTDSLAVVSAGGGNPEPAARIDHAHGEIGSAWPSFLPDGERFLFIGTNAVGAGTIRLGKLGSLDSKAIGKSDGRVEWAPGDWVLFLQGTNLMAQKLDLGAAKLTGAPILVADQLRVGSSSGHFSTSPNGFFAYAKDEGAGELRIATMSRDGHQGKIVAEGRLWNPQLSPDGKKLLCLDVTKPVLGIGEIHALDLDRGTDTRLTFTDNTAFDAAWSPDGRRIAVGTIAGDGEITVRLVAADGLGAQDSIRIGKTTGFAGLMQWSPDGTRIVGFKDRKVWTVPVEGPSRTVSYPIDSTLFSTQGQISPDGRWLACTSGTTSEFRVYAYGIGETTGRIQLSSTRSFRPQWTKGGREIVFESASDLWAVDVDTKNGFAVGTPHRLFALPIAAPSPGFVTWEVDPSGENFYVLLPRNNQGRTQVEVVSDFSTLVSRR